MTDFEPRLFATSDAVQRVGGGGAAPAAAPRAGGLAGMLDLDGDGNPLNDIIGMAGKLFGR